MPLPKKNVAYTFDIGLIDSANRPNFKANPTLATGDFQISTSESAFANLATLPTVSPASSRIVKVALSAAEMNGDRVVVQAVDAAGSEWDDVLIYIDTETNTAEDTYAIVNHATYGNSALNTKIGTPAGASIAADLVVIDNFVDDLETRIVGTLAAGTHNPQTGDAFARLGAPAGASISADVAAVKTDTGAIKTKTDFLPSVTAGGAGGLFIAGANAATSITTALTANITGNLSGSVASVTAGVTLADGAISTLKFAAGAIDAAAIALDAIGASELAADAANEIADAILNRNVAGGSSTGRLVKEALYLLRNKAAIAAGTLTVYGTDDTTSAWTAAITTTAGNPISTVDPA